MIHNARGTFDVRLEPITLAEAPELAAMSIAKSFDGDLVGLASGLMLSGGDPAAGSAGYVAIEVVEGEIDGRVGRSALQQFGTLTDADYSLTYLVTPGSGDGAFDGMTGELELSLVDGVHHYDLAWRIPDTA